MRRLHPATILVVILPKLREAVQTAFPVIVGAFATHRDGNYEWVTALIVGLTGFFAIGAYWTTRFDIEPDHVVHKSGWIFRKDRRIPLEQIQNVNIRQNVLERLLRVATIDVETAMGHGRDLKLSVLRLADAERFREELLGAAHLDVPDRAKADEPIVTLNRHDLLLGALTENHFQQMIVGTFTVIGPGTSVLVNYASKLQSSTLSVLLIGAALIFLALGSWLWGAGSYYLKFGGFTVFRTEKLLRITYGLLNKVQMAIRPNRIEYLNVTATLPQRWMVRASLHAGTAGSFGEAGVLAPLGLFVDRHRAYLGASEVIRGLDIDQLNWQPLHPVFYRASAIRQLVSISIFGVIAYSVSRTGGVAAIVAWTFFAFIALILLASLASLFLSMPENGYAMTEEAFVVRRGYFHQTIAAMPIGRMENMSVRQPWWWKRYGAAQFSVQAMKHRLHVGAMPLSAVEELMSRWTEVIDTRENQRLYETMASEALPESEPEAATIAESA